MFDGSTIVYFLHFSWFTQLFLVNKLHFYLNNNTSSDMISKQRLLGSAENGFMQASQQFKGFTRIGEVLHLQGPHISLNALSMVVNQLQQRHPVLRNRLQINPENPKRYLLEQDNALQLMIREIPRKRLEHISFWREEWRNREKETSIIGQGVAEFWLLQVCKN